MSWTWTVGIEESEALLDARLMKQFQFSPYWRVFKKWMDKELQAIEEAHRQTGTKNDLDMVSRSELNRYQRKFIKWLMEVPDKVISSDFTNDLIEQDKVNDKLIKDLM